MVQPMDLLCVTEADAVVLLLAHGFIVARPGHRPEFRAYPEAPLMAGPRITFGWGLNV